MSRCAHIRLMADYNQWMNAKVYAAAASLPPGELERERGAFFGSLLATLNHVMVGDTLWLQRYAKHPAGFPLLDPIRAITPPASLTHPLFAAGDFAAMQAHRQWLDQVIIDWAASIREEDLDHLLDYRNSKGPNRREFFSLLMHFFNHQTHHRGQASTLLSQAGVDIGDTDLLFRIPNHIAD
jgi:uncharacterized damage-inducible protein DinB